MRKLLFPVVLLSALAGCSSLRSYEIPKNVPTAQVRVAVEPSGVVLSGESHTGVLTELMDQKCENRYQFAGFVLPEKRSRESLKSEFSVIELLKRIEGNSAENVPTFAERVYEFEVEANKAHVFDFLFRESTRSGLEITCGMNGLVAFAPGDNVEVRYRVIRRTDGQTRCELRAFDLVQSGEETIAIPRPISPASCHPFIFR